MSQENVEIVRRSYEAWNAGEMQALHDCYDPGVMIALGPERWAEGEDPIVGVDAVMRLFAQVRRVWDADAMEPVSFTDAGDRVVVHHVHRARGHATDLDIQQAIVCTLREGRICLVEVFWNHDEALKAVGVEE
jgi:ketosteroid isomerase-like protein